MSNPAKVGGKSPGPSHPDLELRVGMAVYDQVCPETMGAVYMLGKYAVLDLVTGTYVDRARNVIASRTEEPYLLFVDADMLFEVEDLNKLKEAMDEDPKIGAIAGMYVHRDGTIKPVCHWIVDGMWMSGKYVLQRCLKNMEAEAIDEVESFGTGFMLIRTEAMKAIGQPYFQTKYDHETQSFWGEDVLFAKRLKEAGWKACIHFGVQVGHIGRAMYMPDTLKGIEIPGEPEDAVQ